jgi:hypothetical protein
VVEVAGTDKFASFVVGEEVPALTGLEVVLHPETLTVGVDPLVGVRAEAVHVTEVLGNSAVAHEVGDLVGGLRAAGPEVPLHVGAAQTVGQSLLGTDEVRELHAVTDEEHRGVVAHDVVVSVLRVELQREPAHVADGVREALLACHGGEPGEHRGDAPLLEEVSTGVPGDVLGDGEFTEGAGALGVDVALGDALTVEVGVLLDEVDVRQGDRALLADSHRVFLGGDGRTIGVGGMPGVGADAAVGDLLRAGGAARSGGAVVVGAHV